MRTFPRSGEDLFALAPVMPVVVLENAEDAVPVARALVAGGLPGIEVTLRTPAALDAIERIAKEVPEAVVGAGTVVTTDQADAAAKAVITQTTPLQEISDSETDPDNKENTK